eukprot:scaffold18902_cov119-Isochrysis_galbana.AAC.3
MSSTSPRGRPAARNTGGRMRRTRQGPARCLECANRPAHRVAPAAGRQAGASVAGGSGGGGQRRSSAVRSSEPISAGTAVPVFTPAANPSDRASQSNALLILHHLIGVSIPRHDTRPRDGEAIVLEPNGRHQRDVLRPPVDVVAGDVPSRPVEGLARDVRKRVPDRRLAAHQRWPALDLIRRSAQSPHEIGSTGAKVVSEDEEIRVPPADAVISAGTERLVLPELAENTVSATTEIASMAETP